MRKIMMTALLLSLQNQICWAEQSALLKAQQSLREAELDCANEDHEFQLLANPIVTADIGGTPEPEAIFDFGALECKGDSWLYRGSLGAIIDIYWAEGEIGFISKSGYQLVPFDGHWAAKFKMHESFSDAQCAQDCCRLVYVQRGGLVETYSQC
jgi:hypothetical protein